MNPATSSISKFNKDYKHAVEKLASDNATLTFNNSGPFHASIVIGSIFKHTNSVVRIYANNMDGTISDIGDYLSELKIMLERKIEVRLVIDQLPRPLSNALQALTNVENSNNVSLRISSQELKNDLASQYNRNTHFIVGDEDMFRLEYDNFQHQALCGFNNRKISSQLINLFDKHFDSCTNPHSN